MALQPIYGEGDKITDYYDDGQPEEEQLSEPHEETLPVEEVPPASSEVDSQKIRTVPDLLKGMNDLFIGITVHHDDGHPQGPLISLFVREVPDGAVTVKTYRAAELSKQAFLDDLQKGVAVTMQAYLMTKAEQQRRRLEEEAKRKARASSTKTIPAEAPASTNTPTMSTKISTKPSPTTPASVQKPEKKAPPAKEAEKKPKYATISMFD